MSDDNLSITAANKHQYYETAMVSVAESDREIREAEARGRARASEEAQTRRKLGVILRVSLVVLAVACVAGGLLFLRR